MSARDLSVVVPLFNEEENIEPLYRELLLVLQKEPISFELILVDDGSTDTTPSKLRLLAMRDRRVEAIRFSRNFGQSAALQAGFDRARGRVVVTMDGDLQNDPQDIPRLLAGIDQGYDVVCGWRRSRRDHLISRKLPSKAANWLIGRLSGVRVHDNGCTLRAYRNELVKRTILLPDMHRFLAPLLSLSGGKWKEIVVHHRARRFGRTKYGLGRIWKVALDLVALKMILRFVSHPAAWFSLLSAPLILLAGLAGIFALVAWISDAPDLEIQLVLPSIALIASSTAIYLTLLGLLAELVVHYGNFRETEPLLVRSVRKGVEDER